MKDGIGEGFTRADHADVSNQLFASYSKVQDARSLASRHRRGRAERRRTSSYLAFGDAFEQQFINQGLDGQPHHRPRRWIWAGSC